MHDPRTLRTDVPLKPPRPRHGLGELARSFLAFREEWDLPWEITEGLMTLCVFILLFLGYEEQEQFAGLLSHVLVGALLILKFLSIAIDGWMRRHPPGLRFWAAQCRLHEPERHHPFKVIRGGHAGDLDACTLFCHRMITDRDHSFTLEKRRRLYGRWAASGQPWMVVTHDADGGILTGSIVLSLTEAAYRSFWHEGALDALDITPAELVGPAAPGRHKYFLVDILAKDKSLIRRLPAAQRAVACGLGVRTLTHHLSLFHAPGTTPNPVLLCSTYSPELMTVLTMTGFERKQGQGALGAPIFRLDAGQTKGLTAEQQWLLDGSRAILMGYANARAPAAGTVANRSHRRLPTAARRASP